MAEHDNKSEMISQFMGVTGADEERASFFLESSAWQLQVALASFFDEPEDSAPMDVASTPVAPPAVPEPRREETEGPPGGTTGGRAKPRKKTKAKSKFATIGDLKGKVSDSDESGEEGQRFYTGGADHGSGQQVVGPRKKNTDSIVTDIFKSAKEHGAEEISPRSPPGSRPGQSPFVFRGAAYRLGESPSDSVAPVPGTAGTLPTAKPKQQHVVLKLWKNGFSIDDGELRDFKSPGNSEFLKSVSNGEIPMELIRQADGGEVNLDLEDHREEEYRQSRSTSTKAFGGQGYVLGNLAPSVVGETSREATAAPEPPSAEGGGAGGTVSPDIDSTQPVTTLQLRLANGSRITGKFNHSHTVADIRRFIATSRPEYASISYKLMTTFPNNVLGDDSQTISEANLLNAVIVQRLT